MKETDANNENLPFAPYLIPTIALLAGCCAIEGYINMVGQKVDPNWVEFDKGPVPIKDRIARLYGCVGEKADFSRGIWQRVLKLFKTRNELVHPRYIETEEERDADIPNVFQAVGSKYSPSRSMEISELAIDTLLADTKLTSLRHKYLLKTYHGPIRDPAP